MRGLGWIAAVWLASSALVLAPRGAQAQDDASHGTDTVELEDDAARGLYEVASAHYAQGHLEEAAHEFEESYRLSHRPLLLYNAYVAYRDANLRADSARTLRAYLESGVEDARRTNLEARLQALEAELSASQAALETATPPSEAAPVVTEPASPPAAPPSHDLANVVAPVLFASAGVLIVAAAITGGLAVAKHDELASACPGGVCDASRQGDIDSLGTLALVTDVVGAIGIATAIAGVIVLAVDLSSGGSESAPSASLGCGPSGCSIRGTF